MIGQLSTTTDTRTPRLALFCLLFACCFISTIAFQLPSDDSLTPPTSVSWATYAAQWPTQAAPPSGASGQAQRVSVLHINDLYELISSGSMGGVARLATLLKNLKELNPQTMSLLAGDLFSPSALSTVAIEGLDGDSFNGAQMVAAMNELKLDAATLGNHETDVTAAEFAARLEESQFKWHCINALVANYSNLTPDGTFQLAAGSPIIAVFGLNLDSNNKAFQHYADFNISVSMAQMEVADLTNRSDVVIALTHLPYWHDQTLAATVPGIDLIVGGHEHIRSAIPGTPGIFKADSNVHSAWIHDLWIDPSLPRSNPLRLHIISTLIDLDSSLADDADMAKVVQGYVDQAFQGFTNAGFAPADFLATVTDDLVGTNDVIFQQPTNLTQLFNLACIEEVEKYASDSFILPPIDATLFNAGAIRIDDTIPAGTSMTQYDAIRISPYLNAVLLVNMSGTILKKALDLSEGLLGNSQHLHSYPNVTTASDGSWLINGVALDTNRWYSVGVLKFLLKGKAPYGFLEPSATNTQLYVLAGDVSSDPPSADVRKSLIDQIALRYNPNGDSHDSRFKSFFGMQLWQLALIITAMVIIIALSIVLYIKRAKSKPKKDDTIINEWSAHANESHDYDDRVAIAARYTLQSDNKPYESQF